MLDKDVLHEYELFGKYAINKNSIQAYSDKGIIKKHYKYQPYWKILIPEQMPKNDAIKSINNCCLYKSRNKFWVLYPDEAPATEFDTKEGAIEYMKSYSKFKTTTGSGYTVKFSREEMLELYQHFGDSHNIGIAIKRLL